jgi:hypothetical protein
LQSGPAFQTISFIKAIFGLYETHKSCVASIMAPLNLKMGSLVLVDVLGFYLNQIAYA